MQIIVESFPVSSSGHCYLLLNLLKKFESNCTDVIFHQGIYTPIFIESFDHVLHLITLLVLAVFFFDRWEIYLLRFRFCLPLFFKAVGLTALADIVTACFYLFFKIYPVQLPLIIGFGITAMSLMSIYMITAGPSTKLREDGKKSFGFFDRFFYKNYKLHSSFQQSREASFSPSAVLPELCRRGNGESNSFNIRTALILGLVQGIALLPGISRLATTYAAARWLGLQPRKAFEISWLIAVPLFLAASVQGMYKIVHMSEVHRLVMGSLPYIACAGIFAYVALKITAHLFYTNRAWWFGVYMVAPIVSILLFL